MPKSIIDIATRRQIFLQRYAGGRAKEARLALARIRREVVKRLSETNTTEFQSNRLTTILADIDNMLIAGFAGITNTVRDDIFELMVNETKFTRRMVAATYGDELALPSDYALHAAIALNPMKMEGSEVTIEAALYKLTEVKRREIRQIISDGVVLADVNKVVADRVGEIMSTLHRRQLESLVRTAINHASSVARLETYAANDDIIEGYEWVATLDGRTTLICANRDGEVYQVGKGPLPPAHWGCRSTTVPDVKGRQPVGLRASMNGPVPGGTVYPQWLKQQPAAVVESVLGKRRAGLFREGKLSLDRFVDPTGRLYTLKQLEESNPLIFSEN